MHQVNWCIFLRNILIVLVSAKFRIGIDGYIITNLQTRALKIDSQISIEVFYESSKSWR